MKLLIVICLFSLSLAAFPISVQDTGVFVPVSIESECDNLGYLAGLPNIAAKVNSLIASGVRCIHFPVGLYHSSDIIVRSDLTIVLGKQSVIKVIPGETKVGLIVAVSVDRFAIIGEGKLHGSAEMMIARYDPVDNRFSPRSDLPRPRMIHFEHVNGALIEGIRVHNSSSWNLHLIQSNNLRIDGVDVYGDSRFPNNDGIDPDSCVNVTIINTRIEVADDGICPKVQQPGQPPLSNLFVQDCVIRSSSHAIKFGSRTYAEMHDILFDRIKIWDSNAGISIQHRAVGWIHNVTWSNIDIETRYYAPRWWGNAEPISITAEERAHKAPNPEDIGYISELRFINITARSENSAFISAKTHGMNNIEFTNVKIALDHWSNYSLPGAAVCVEATYSNVSTHETEQTDCRGSIDRRPAVGGSGYNVRWASKASPFILENVHGLTMTNVTGSYIVGSKPRPKYWETTTFGCFNFTKVDFKREPEHIKCIDSIIVL